MKPMGTWEYFTAKQRDREKSQEWLSIYSDSSKHISHMDEILMVYRSHRGLLNEDAYNFVMHGILAMHQYLKIDNMKRLKEQIDTLIQEKEEIENER